MNRFLQRIVFVVLGRQLIMFLLSRRPSILELSRQILLFVLSLAASILVGWILIDSEETRRRLAAEPPVRARRSLPTSDRQADDLTVIDGIGAVYARTLNELGITTFAKLAGQNPVELSHRTQGRISAERIRNQNWIGQAEQLSRQ